MAALLDGREEQFEVLRLGAEESDYDLLPPDLAECIEQLAYGAGERCEELGRRARLLRGWRLEEGQECVCQDWYELVEVRVEELGQFLERLELF